jgi:hypothetical protein
LAQFAHRKVIRSLHTNAYLTSCVSTLNCAQLSHCSPQRPSSLRTVPDPASRHSTVPSCPSVRHSARRLYGQFQMTLEHTLHFTCNFPVSLTVRDIITWMGATGAGSLRQATKFKNGNSFPLDDVSGLINLYRHFGGSCCIRLFVIRITPSALK